MIKQDELQSLQQGHRARLRKKFLDGQLAEYEILELILTYAIPRRDVRTLSRQLYKKYGSIHKILAEPFESLVKNEGIKENTATFLKILFELTKMEYKSTLGSDPIFYNQEKLENYCRLLLMSKGVEEFHVFYLDAKHKLLEDQLHSTGTVDWTAVYIREIVKRALDLNARSVVVVHNHPTPDAVFSEQDIVITTDLENALNQLGITLYDHLLVAGDIVYSARTLRLLDKSRNHSSYSSSSESASSSES